MRWIKALLLLALTSPCMAQISSNATKLRGANICNPLTLTNTFGLTWVTSTKCFGTAAVAPLAGPAFTGTVTFGTSSIANNGGLTIATNAGQWSVSGTMISSALLTWQNGGSIFAGAIDTSLSRLAASVLGVNSAGSAGSGASVRAASYQSGGTTFTLSGCSADTPVGGATAGTYTSHTGGTCTVVITMNGATGLTAPNGWACSASDRTTPADIQQQTASSATTATLSGTTVTGDVIGFHCIGY